MWRYEGSKTLAYYLKRRDCMPALARDLRVPEAAVPATVLKHVLESLTVGGALVVKGAGVETLPVGGCGCKSCLAGLVLDGLTVGSAAWGGFRGQSRCVSGCGLLQAFSMERHAVGRAARAGSRVQGPGSLTGVMY